MSELADLFYEYALNVDTDGNDIELSERYAEKAKKLILEQIN